METQYFDENKPIYDILPRPSELNYIMTLKLSQEFFEDLSRGNTEDLSIIFGDRTGNQISLGGKVYSFESNSEGKPHDLYVKNEESGFTMVGPIKKKLLLSQDLREQDKLRLRTRTDSAADKRKAHRSVLIVDPKKKKSSKETTPRKRRKTLMPSSQTTQTSSTTGPSPTNPTPSAVRKPSTKKAISKPRSLGRKTLASKSNLTAPTKSITSTGQNGVNVEPPIKKTTPAEDLETKLIQVLAPDPLSYFKLVEKFKGNTNLELKEVLGRFAQQSPGHRYYLRDELFEKVDLKWKEYSAEERVKAEDRVQDAKKAKLSGVSMNAGIIQPETNAPLEAQGTYGTGEVTNNGNENNGLKRDASEMGGPPTIQNKGEVKRTKRQPLANHNNAFNSKITNTQDTSGFASKMSTNLFQDTEPVKFVKAESKRTDKSEAFELKPIGSQEELGLCKKLFEEKYKVYLELNNKIKENTEYFKKLGEEFQNEDNSTKQRKVAEKIELAFNERHKEQKKVRAEFQKLDKELRSAKFRILAFTSVEAGNFTKTKPFNKM